jgi:hypothetical protein
LDFRFEITVLAVWLGSEFVRHDTTRYRALGAAGVIRCVCWVIQRNRIQYFLLYATVQTHVRCPPNGLWRQTHAFDDAQQREKSMQFDPAQLVKNRLVPITLTRAHIITRR